VPGHKLRKGDSNQADAEFAEDNVLPGAESYYPDDDDVPPEVFADEEEDVYGVGEDDDEDRPGVEEDDSDPEDEGEGSVEIDPETGEPVRYLDADMEAEHERTLKRFFQVTGIDITQFRGRGDDDG
jgi:hypothetical protein